jgi:hypothetical protein
VADKPPIDHVAMRRQAAETYEVSIGMAAQHLAHAEAMGTDARMGAHRHEHLRFAEVYALLARACQKIPGSQF